MDLPPNAPRRKCDRYIFHPDDLKSILENVQSENKQNGRQRRENENKNSKDPFRGDIFKSTKNDELSFPRNWP